MAGAGDGENFQLNTVNTLQGRTCDLHQEVLSFQRVHLPPRFGKSDLVFIFASIVVWGVFAGCAVRDSGMGESDHASVCPQLLGRQCQRD